MADAKLAHLGDVLVRGSDAELCKEGRWINDTVASYCLEMFRQGRRGAGDAQGVLFVDVAVMFLIAHADDDTVAQIARDIGVGRADVVLALVSDSPFDDDADHGMKANGGSHWSLCAYLAADGVFYHYDSLPRAGMFGAQHAAAVRVAMALAPHVKGRDGRQFDDRCFAVAREVPAQTNSYACGWHALSSALKVSQHRAACAGASPQDAEALRQSVAEDIARRAQEERRGTVDPP